MGNFLEDPAVGKSRVSGDLSDNLIGRKLGPFTLLEVIGEGGGGSVYLAGQSVPVRRQVALKILKLGLDTKSVIARFEAERQTIARMEHPHIASVIEAGATEEGRPYFAMEYVPGSPVTEYCDERRLPVEERLLIFIMVCRAIEHAHQKGVIHRDLKPSNILVREQEGQAVPKVIDFGVAKAVDASADEAAGFTINDAIIGTPAYMSPEQAGRGNRDIDTRADIYSLGVILYELFTGTTPLKATTSGLSGTPEVLRLLSEVDPPRPSTFFKSLNEEEREAVANRRGSTAARLSAKLQGDLDWIAMKCLEKDRARRFGSASELSRDVELHLKGLPVTARPPSRRYRFRKFVGRNRGAMASASLFLATLIGAAVISLVFGVRATKAEKMEAEMRKAAVGDRELALKSVEEARLHQYVANINLAHQALLDGHVSKALLLLEPWAEPGELDLRGFEWWLLMEKCHGDEHLSLPLFDDPIEALSFSPDGEQLAIASGHGVHLWSLEQKEFLATYPHRASSVTFSQGGDRLIMSGQDGIVVIDVISGEVTLELEGRNPGYAMSPNDGLLATSDRQGVTLWNTSNWEREKYFPNAFGSLAFSPDGRTLASEGREGVTLWPLEGDAAPVVLEESPPLRIGSDRIQFSRDGGTVILAQNEDPTEAGFALGLWDVRSGKEVAMLPRNPGGGFHTGAISATSFSRDGTLLATSSWDHSVRLWDFKSGSRRRTLLGHRGEVWSVALSPDGDFIASGSKDGEVRIWPSAKGSDGESIQGDWTPLGFPHDNQSISAYGGEGELATFDLASGSRIESREKTSLAPRASRRHAVSANRDLSLIAEDRGNGEVTLRDPGNTTETVLQAGVGRIDSLALSPDGKSLVVGNRSDGMAWWDLENPGEPPIRIEASRVSFSADASTLVGIDRQGNALIWDSRTREVRNRLQLGETSAGTRLALSGDGSLLAVSHGFRDYQNTISLWNTVNGEGVGSLNGHKQAIWSLAFSPDGRTLASSGGERIIRLWNISTRSELLMLKEPGSAFADLSFTPDGRFLISSSPSFASSPMIRIFRSLSPAR
jgi:serine/threonine protein kinase/WD40 repeat protein